MNKCNQYNPGNDFDNIPKKQHDPNKKPDCSKEYSSNCIYNTQGEYICQPRNLHDTQLGYHYILNIISSD